MSENFLDKGDKELDEFLKKISDEAKIPFSEGDWKAMESRLDESMAPSPTVWKKNFLPGALVLLLAGMIAYLVLDQEEPIQLETITQSEVADQTSAYVENSVKEIPANDRDESLLAKEAAKPKPVDPNKKSNNDNPISGAIGDEDNQKATKSPTVASKNSVFSKLSTFGFQDPDKSLASVKEEIENNEDSTLVNSISNKDSVDITTTELDVSKKSEKKPKGKFGGKFNISFQLAPDLSAIQLDQIGKAGNMIGLGAEYFVLPKVSLSSGVFYSYKTYSGDSGNNPSYGKTPTYIIGACDILDIPLNFRFYVLEGKVQRFFISTGVSSYLMLKEKYELKYYDQNTGEPYFREIEVKGANQHYFGIANFSVGYERKLGRQLGIQVEPYFKIPFSGVGEGDVSLKSTGIFVGLKYYPGKR